jgi:hypothetical protein
MLGLGLDIQRPRCMEKSKCFTNHSVHRFLIMKSLFLVDIILMVSNLIPPSCTKIKELLSDKINNLSGWMNLRLDRWEINLASFLVVWVL